MCSARIHGNIHTPVITTRGVRLPVLVKCSGTTLRWKQQENSMSLYSSVSLTLLQPSARRGLTLNVAATTMSACGSWTRSLAVGTQKTMRRSGSRYWEARNSSAVVLVLRPSSAHESGSASRISVELEQTEQINHCCLFWRKWPGGNVNVEPVTLANVAHRTVFTHGFRSSGSRSHSGFLF